MKNVKNMHIKNQNISKTKLKATCFINESCKERVGLPENVFH